MTSGLGFKVDAHKTTEFFHIWHGMALKLCYVSVTSYGVT